MWESTFSCQREDEIAEHISGWKRCVRGMEEDFARQMRETPFASHVLQLLCLQLQRVPAFGLLDDCIVFVKLCKKAVTSSTVAEAGQIKNWKMKQLELRLAVEAITAEIIDNLERVERYMAWSFSEFYTVDRSCFSFSEPEDERETVYTSDSDAESAIGSSSPSSGPIDSDADIDKENNIRDESITEKNLLAVNEEGSLLPLLAGKEKGTASVMEPHQIPQPQELQPTHLDTTVTHETIPPESFNGGREIEPKTTTTVQTSAGASSEVVHRSSAMNASLDTQALATGIPVAFAESLCAIEPACYGSNALHAICLCERKLESGLSDSEVNGFAAHAANETDSRSLAARSGEESRCPIFLNTIDIFAEARQPSHDNNPNHMYLNISSTEYPSLELTASQAFGQGSESGAFTSVPATSSESASTSNSSSNPLAAAARKSNSNISLLITHLNNILDLELPPMPTILDPMALRSSSQNERLSVKRYRELYGDLSQSPERCKEELNKVENMRAHQFYPVTKKILEGMLLSFLRDNYKQCSKNKEANGTWVAETSNVYRKMPSTRYSRIALYELWCVRPEVEYVKGKAWKQVKQLKKGTTFRQAIRLLIQYQHKNMCRSADLLLSRAPHNNLFEITAQEGDMFLQGVADPMSRYFIRKMSADEINAASTVLEDPHVTGSWTNGMGSAAREISEFNSLRSPVFHGNGSVQDNSFEVTSPYNSSTFLHSLSPQPSQSAPFLSSALTSCDIEMIDSEGLAQSISTLSPLLYVESDASMLESP
jgi:hypothetical protein